MYVYIPKSALGDYVSLTDKKDQGDSSIFKIRQSFVCVCVSELLGLPSVLTLACGLQNQEHMPPILSAATGATLTDKEFLGDPCILSAQ